MQQKVKKEKSVMHMLLFLRYFVISWTSRNYDDFLSLMIQA